MLSCMNDSGVELGVSDVLLSVLSSAPPIVIYSSVIIYILNTKSAREVPVRRRV
jgi:hypothetical protein